MVLVLNYSAFSEMKPDTCTPNQTRVTLRQSKIYNRNKSVLKIDTGLVHVNQVNVL